MYQVKPISPKLNIPTVIEYDDAKVSVANPQKHDDLRSVLRKYGFRWDYDLRSWNRSATMKTGAARHRAAEIGRAILEAGFAVEFPDEPTMTAAINGTYELEQTRWVCSRGDKFAVSWSRDEDYYAQARRIAGARYSAPEVVVPSASFEDVLDFAEIYDFTLSEGAKKLVETARQQREQILVVDITSMPERKATRRKPKKIIPTGKIADELRDESFRAPTGGGG